VTDSFKQQLALESAGASVAAVQHHYDASNDFYRLWLDQSTMSYTCAMFLPDESSRELEQAQVRKVDYHIEQGAAAGASRILDIGCGWGNLLGRLTQQHGVEQAVGLTLSQEQARHIAAQRDPRIEVRLESWVQHAPPKPYDAIFSIESIEAFVKPTLDAEQRLDVYRALFSRCHDWLRPGGRMSFQLICYGNSGREDLDSFIAQEIFPESDLPRLAEIAEAVERRFEILSLRNDRADYVRTLRAWLERLKARRDEAVRLLGEPAVVRYERYLRLSSYIFQTGACDLFRITLQRIDRPRNARR